MIKTAKAKTNNVDGLLLIDKPLKISSRLALTIAKRALNAAKAGHSGALDPLASGVLPLLFGEATKFAGYLLDADKSYQFTVKLGQTTTTGDAEGEIASEAELPNLADVNWPQLLQQFQGEIEQVPPLFSALKYQGKPLYYYARKGETVPVKSRLVTIHKLELQEITEDSLSFEVRCSKGTYVRTLAQDIGQALGCGGYVTALRRLDAAGFALEQCVTLEQLDEDAKAYLLPVEYCVAHFPRLQLTSLQRQRLYHGLGTLLDPIQQQALGEHQVIALYCDEAGFFGLGRPSGELLRAQRLLSCKAPA